MMHGLELSRRYWEAYGASLFEGLPDEVRLSAAAGLVGAGSECLGFDDELSDDHDFGPGFCVWLPREQFRQWGSELARRYQELPAQFLGYERSETQLAGQRIGVWETETFYRQFTGLERAPQTPHEWFAIPEQLLALATNGEVFFDPSGEFSSLRHAYEAFYPDGVIRKKIAADCASMAQAGQYNLFRCLTRGDVVAAGYARTEFLMSCMAALHLLHRVYMPFYKWSYRSLCEKTSTSRELCQRIHHIAEIAVADVQASEVESVCAVLTYTLRRLGWATTTNTFLLESATELQNHVRDSELKELPISAGQFR